MKYIIIALILIFLATFLVTLYAILAVASDADDIAAMFDDDYGEDDE